MGEKYTFLCINVNKEGNKLFACLKNMIVCGVHNPEFCFKVKKMFCYPR